MLNGHAHGSREAFTLTRRTGTYQMLLVWVKCPAIDLLVGK